MVKLMSPYMPGFLAFREAGFLVEKIDKVRREKPEIMPQAVLVDGNGILHTKSALSNFLFALCYSIMGEPLFPGPSFDCTRNILSFFSYIFWTILNTWCITGCAVAAALL